ncbi:flagellar assembly protein FliH [Paraferrimonas sedimenticola]|uniref:Flagellar assembly protein FliH n=2 Tax=Paraferrimonas sedimenticola TaxID=375674 RepID=A0AA37RUV9_9GAMM|nr:flagellar assembly protein FliH [Paraferrimonas sedimenticola]
MDEAEFVETAPSQAQNTEPKMAEQPEFEAADLSNAFGVDLAAMRAQAQAESNLPKPPTMEEIEAIRQSAFDEGMLQGHEQGFAQGLEEGRQTGQEEGRQQGLAEGREQGLAEGKQLAIEQAERWQTLNQQLAQPLAVIDEQVEHQLLALALELAEQVVMAEISQKPEHILQALRAGIEALPKAESGVRIEATAEDKALIEDFYTAEQLQEQNWQLFSNPQLNPGELALASAHSKLNWNWSDRVQSVTQAIREQLNHTAEDSNA